MLYRPLGRTGLSVSEIGFGCASWWGMPAFAETEAAALVHAALDHGVTLFDTAPGYSRGEAEPRLGRALKGQDISKLIVATKAGTRFEAGRMVRDMTLPAIVASVEASLRRLGLESLPVVQLHGPGLGELTDEFAEGLRGLKTRGLVRALGVNSFDPAVIDRAIALPVFDLAMVDYNVLRPERAPLIARARAAGKGVLAGMALAMGHTQLQTLKLRRPRDVWYALRALKNHRADIVRGARLTFLNKLPGLTGAQAALAYVLGDPCVSSAIVGATRMPHLLENLGASGLALPAEARARIDAAG